MKQKQYVMKGSCIDCDKTISMQSVRCRRCQGLRRTRLNTEIRKEKAGL